MVAISSGKILITGGAGFIGAWVLKSAVDRGFTVVAALRNDAQGEEVTKSLPEYEGKVSYIVVPDITKEDAYDEAVKDVDGIIHVASPVFWDWEDPSEIIGPAIAGFVNILKSAHKFGHNVKRVVITSSSVAVHDYLHAEPGRVYDETVWNEISTKYVEENGKKSSPWQVYNASKVYSEKATWEWVKANNPKFDVTAILPVYCYGPFNHNAKKRLGTTPEVFLGTFSSADTSGKWVGDSVDVRDVGAALVESLIVPEAGGERILISSDIFSWQDLYDVLNEAGFPNIPGKDAKGAGANKGTTRVSNAKSLKLFGPRGFKYNTFKEYITDMGTALNQNGYFKAPEAAA